MHTPGSSRLLAWLALQAALELQHGARNLVTKARLALMVVDWLSSSSSAKAIGASWGSGVCGCVSGSWSVFSRSKTIHEGWLLCVCRCVVRGGTIVDDSGGIALWLGTSTASAEHTDCWDVFGLKLKY